MNRTAVATLALASLLTVPVFAGNHRGPGGPHHDKFHRFHGGDGADGADVGERIAERHAERLTRALDLTDAQQATLQSLQATLGETIRPLFESMRTTREALEALLDSANPDPAAVGAKAIALHQTKASMKGAHETFEEGIVSMLTETQRAQYEALREVRPDRGRGERWGRSRR